MSSSQVNQSGDHMDAQGELNWLAFLYVAGELTAKDAADFEHRLTDDQQAREAVAAAVELSQAAVLAKWNAKRGVPEPPTSEAGPVRPTERHLLRRAGTCESIEYEVTPQSRAPAWLARPGWLVAGIAAALLVVAMVEGLRVERKKDSNVPRDSFISAVAVQWIEFRERTDEEWEQAAAGITQMEPTSLPDLAGGESSEDLYSPDWLLVALAESQSGEPNVPPVTQDLH